MTTLVKPAPPWADEITEEMRDAAWETCACGKGATPALDAWGVPVRFPEGSEGFAVSDGHSIILQEAVGPDLLTILTREEPWRDVARDPRDTWRIYVDEREGSLREMDFSHCLKKERGVESLIPWWLAFVPRGLDHTVWLDARKVAFLMEAVPFDSAWGDEKQGGVVFKRGDDPVAVLMPLRGDR